MNWRVALVAAVCFVAGVAAGRWLLAPSAPPLKYHLHEHEGRFWLLDQTTGDVWFRLADPNLPLKPFITGPGH